MGEAIEGVKVRRLPMLHLQEAAALQGWLEHRIERCHRQRRRGLQGADESLARQQLLLKVLHLRATDSKHARMGIAGPIKDQLPAGSLRERQYIPGGRERRLHSS